MDNSNERIVSTHVSSVDVSISLLLIVSLFQKSFEELNSYFISNGSGFFLNKLGLVGVGTAAVGPADTGDAPLSICFQVLHNTCHTANPVLAQYTSVLVKSVYSCTLLPMSGNTWETLNFLFQNRLYI